MKRILIIGANGFIGKNIVSSLSENKNYFLFLFSREKNIGKVSFDISDINSTKNFLEKNNIDIVIHLASNLIPSSSSEEFKREVHDLILPTFKLLETLSDLNIKLIFFSSGGTIYKKSNQPISENHQIEPINYYGYSKTIIESYITFLNKTQGLNYIILRPSNVYGKFQRTDRQQGFIAVTLKKILSNQPIEIYGDGSIIRDYIDVNDLAKITQKLIEADISNETFNIGTGIGTSLNEIVSIYQNYFNKQLDIKYISKRKIDSDIVVLDITKLSHNIQYRSINLRDGLLNYINFIFTNSL